MDKKILTTVQETLEELLKNLDILAQAEISFDELEEAVLVSLTSDDNALLVGYHGKNLSAIQTVLGLMVYKKTGQWFHIVVDVDNYREKRQAQIEEMARRAVEQAKSTGQSIAIANLGSRERRQVHLLFKDDPTVKTYSEGEGRNRQLIVSVK
ncbi:MAG: KH domain-containing protein [Candidatus Shapirobacteria bacterium]|nr:KH domain-containing protein [Candidatus Shapirobacteria bacterium]